MQIDVLMTGYRSVEYTKRAILSILRNARNAASGNVRLWVINNSAHEKEGEELNEYLTGSRNSQKEGVEERFVEEFTAPSQTWHKSCVVVITPPSNLGWVGGINYGLGKLTDPGDAIVLCGNDINASFGWDTELMKALESDPKVGLAVPTTNYAASAQQVIQGKRGIEELPYAIGFFMMFRKEALKDVGWGLDARFGSGEKGVDLGSDDLDVSISLRKKGWKIVVNRDCFIHHYGQRSVENKLRATFPDGKDNPWERGNEKLIEKWGDGVVQKVLASRITIPVLIGMPSIGSITHQAVSSLHGLQKPNGTSLMIVSRLMVHMARNMIIDTALEKGIPYVLFMDDDMELLDPQTLLRLMAHDKDIVGALAFRRAPPYSPCAFHFRDERNKEFPAGMMVPITAARIHTGLIEIDAVGMGAMLVKTDVFRRYKEEWDKISGGEKWRGWCYFDDWGEDIQFCMNAKKLGYKVYCDTDLEVGHVGQMTVRSDAFFGYQKLQERKFWEAQKRQKKNNNLKLVEA